MVEHCQEHAGYEARIEHLEKGFETLGKKLDKLIFITVGAFAMGAINLIVMLAGKTPTV